MKFFLNGLIALVILFAAITNVGMAQTGTTGEIAGTVKDSSGAIVPNAAVTLKALDTGESRAVQSDGSGAFRFSFLRPGDYTVTASVAGLMGEPVRTSAQLGVSTTADLTMRPRSSTTVVEVTEAAELVNTENASQNTTYNAKQVQDLPTPGGDITAFAYSAPGVVMSTGAGYGAFSSHGLPATSNLFTINGQDNVDPYLNLNNSGASNLTLGQNEIAEASIVQNAYAVQYGRGAGTQVSYVTKSGGNQVHGTLSFNYNSSGFNANDFFNNASGNNVTPKAVSRQYAASIGGPVIKNKLFFFADTEGIRYVLPSSTNFLAIPSPQLQTYVLSTVSPAQVPFYQKAFALYNGAPGASSAQPITNGSGPNQDGNNALGCGTGTLPGTVVAGVGTFGVNVPCASVFTNNVGSLNTEWLATVRGDYIISDRQRIFLRYKTDQGVQATGTDPINPVFNTNSHQPEYEGQITHNYVISPTVVNNLVFSSSWSSAIFGPTDIQAAAAALPARLQIADGGSNGGGFASVGLSDAAAYPQGREPFQVELIDDLSVIKGKHSLKFGVNYKFDHIKDTSGAEGSVIGTYSINDLGEFATGAFNDANTGSTFSQTYSKLGAVNIQVYSVGYYAQDEWAVRPDMKFTFGLRMDTNSNPVCDQNCFSRFNNSFFNIEHGADIPFNQDIKSAQQTLYPSSTWFVPQPRLGLVYSPGSSKKTVIRTGIGLFSDLAPALLSLNVFRNLPNTYTPTITAGLIGDASVPGSGYALGLQGFQALEAGFSNGATLSSLSSAVGAAGFTTPTFYNTPQNLKNPKYLEYSFEVERQVGSRNVITIGYYGNMGYDEFVINRDSNAYANPDGSKPTFAGLPSAPLDPRFRRIYQVGQYGQSNYNGGTIQYRRGLGFGFSGQIAYTYSHALDDVSNGGLGEPFNISESVNYQLDPTSLNRLNYSNADYDIRHNLTGDFLWEIPFRFQSRLLKQAIGGWTYGARYIVRTGTPFSVTNSRIAGQVSPDLGAIVLADIVNPSVNTNCGASAVNTPCFSASDFATTATQNGFGSQRRNTFVGPGYANVDLTLYKKFQIFERAEFVLGAQMYNVLNHPNFATPAASGNNSVNASGFGTIASTVSAPSSPYGSFEGSGTSGRIIVVQGKFNF